MWRRSILHESRVWSYASQTCRTERTITLERWKRLIACRTMAKNEGGAIFPASFPDSSCFSSEVTRPFTQHIHGEGSGIEYNRAIVVRISDLQQCGHPSVTRGEFPDQVIRIEN